LISRQISHHFSPQIVIAFYVNTGIQDRHQGFPSGWPVVAGLALPRRFCDGARRNLEIDRRF
jgi:hypothetical protein